MTTQPDAPEGAHLLIDDHRIDLVLLYVGASPDGIDYWDALLTPQQFDAFDDGHAHLGVDRWPARTGINISRIDDTE